MEASAVFHNERKELVPSCTYKVWRENIDRVMALDRTGLPALAEVAAFSYGMVVRYALGLSSTGGKVCAFVGDSFSSYIVLATLRHLVNSGASGTVVVMGPTSSGLDGYLEGLRSRGVTIVAWTRPRWRAIHPHVEHAHNALSGIFELGSGYDSFRRCFVEEMNESHVPVHSVGVPAGVHPDGEEMEDSALYSSSTLSLGLPLQGLSLKESFIGRHYLCDLSWPIDAYRLAGYDGEPLFAEQPVIRVLSAV